MEKSKTPWFSLATPNPHDEPSVVMVKDLKGANIYALPRETP